jgi:hypothetical protein
VPETIFWLAIGSIGVWAVIYLSLLLGFMLDPRKKPSRQPPTISAAGYAAAIWVLCIGDFLMGPFFAVVLIAVSLMFGLIFVRKTSVKRMD